MVFACPSLRLLLLRGGRGQGRADRPDRDLPPSEPWRRAESARDGRGRGRGGRIFQRQERSNSSGSGSQAVGSPAKQPNPPSSHGVPQQMLPGLPPPMYYVQPPQMYYPPTAYAYQGGLPPNAPPRSQVEEAVRKQVGTPADLTGRISFWQLYMRSLVLISLQIVSSLATAHPEVLDEPWFRAFRSFVDHLKVIILGSPEDHNYLLDLFVLLNMLLRYSKLSSSAVCRLSIISAFKICAGISSCAQR